MECTKLNCPMQVGTVTENCGDSCPWRTTVKLDDLISRALLLNEFRSLCGPQTGDGWDNMVVRNLIMRQKSVDAVPVVQGEWVEEPDRVNHYHCSNCGVAWGVVSKAMKYCPNCAAKMTNCPMWEVEDAK